MIFSLDALTVQHNGRSATLNPDLVERQRLDQRRLDRLKATHVERLRLFEAMEATEDRAELRRLALAFDDLEYVQQALWGFERTAAMHRWFDVPHCRCPKHQNDLLLGSGERLTNPECPLHGADDPMVFPPDNAAPLDARGLVLAEAVATLTKGAFDVSRGREAEPWAQAVTAGAGAVLTAFDALRDDLTQRGILPGFVTEDAAALDHRLHALESAHPDAPPEVRTALAGPLAAASAATGALPPNA